MNRSSARLVILGRVKIGTGGTGVPSRPDEGHSRMREGRGREVGSVGGSGDEAYHRESGQGKVGVVTKIWVLCRRSA